MLIVKIKKGENITKALKRFKNKVRNTKLVKNIREGQYFSKPSEIKRKKKKKAIKVNQWRLKNEDI